MRTNTEIQHLLKAFDAFKKRILVISPDFKILAATRPPETFSEKDLTGKYCYQEFHNRKSPCDNCAVEEVLKRHTPSLCPKPYPLGRSAISYGFLRDWIWSYYERRIWIRGGIEQ